MSYSQNLFQHLITITALALPAAIGLPCGICTATGDKPELISGTESTIPVSTTPVAKPLKQLPGNGLTNHLDNMHDNLFLRLQRPVQKIDEFFAKDKETRPETPAARFRLGLYMLVRDADEISTRLEPDIEAEIRLPSLEERWGVFIDSKVDKELPGTDPTEREHNLNTGVRRIFKEWNLHADAGVRWRSGPAALTRLDWLPKFHLGNTMFYPRQRFFYESWDGYGEKTSLTMNRNIGCCFARLVSAARWSEHSNGWEWEQSALLGHVGRLIEENRPCELVNDDDIAKGLGLRYSVFGHNSTTEHQIDRHRLTLVYRYPLYKNWIFLQLAPGLEWLNEDAWDTIPYIQFGLDTLFWEVTRN